jgi:hypothetical protein
MLSVIYNEGIFPYGRNADRLNWGNIVQLWVFGPVFWFGLNPFWLYGAIQSLWRLEADMQKQEKPLESHQRMSDDGYATAESTTDHATLQDLLSDLESKKKVH